MACGNVTIPVSRVLRDITVTVKLTGVQRLKTRLWVGRQLIKLAAVIMGLGIQFPIEIDYHQRVGNA